MVGLIKNNDYRNEVNHLALWCSNNDLLLNVKKNLRSTLNTPQVTINIVKSISSTKTCINKPAAHSKYSRKDHWCLTALPPGHLRHPPSPQSSQHCGRLHTPLTQPFQSSAIWKEVVEPPNLLHQTEKKFHPPCCQDANHIFLSPLLSKKV